MTLKLNANHQLVWLDPNTMQLGLSRNKVVLHNVSAGQEKLIDALYFGVAPNQLEALAKQNRMTLAEAQDLVRSLSGLLERDFEGAGGGAGGAGGAGGVVGQAVGIGKVPGGKFVPPINLESAHPEVVAAGLQYSTDGSQVLQARSRMAVYIDTLDNTGLLLAGALAAAGVGVIVSGDERPVTQQDVTGNGYPQGLLGHPRVAAARLMLESTVGSCRVVEAHKLKPKQLGAVSLAIIVAQQVIQPARYQNWVSAGVPHLAITYSADFVEVSPVVTANTGCLYCQQLWLQEHDSTWSVVSSQLHASPLRFDSGWLRLIACGLAVQSALKTIDVGASGAAGVRYTMSSGEAEPLHWERHPGCSCALVGLQQLQEA